MRKTMQLNVTNETWFEIALIQIFNVADVKIVEEKIQVDLKCFAKSRVITWDTLSTLSNQSSKKNVSHTVSAFKLKTRLRTFSCC